MIEPDKLNKAQLACAAELAFEMAVLRDECCKTAELLAKTAPLDEIALEECARLDDALRIAQTAIGSTLRGIQAMRQERSAKRRR